LSGKRIEGAEVTEQGLVSGKVARILNSQELVINRGRVDGVRVGMVFAVLDPKAEDVKDPDTGEVLGSVNRPKTYVKVVDVEERLAVAQTFRKFGGGGALGLTGVAALFGPREPVLESLKTTESTWEDLDESESYVKTGDPVREERNPPH
jgi:hypothetical protein